MSTTLPRKAIDPARDRRQSAGLTGVTATLLTALAIHREIALLAHGSPTLAPVAISLLFALCVLALRSATPAAAALGAVICFLLATAPSSKPPHAISPLLLALIALFVLTFLATRFGRAAKQRRGLAEPRSGRRASQIAANLGIAGFCAAAGLYPCALAALAEATADTVSSETGQALGGRTWLLTTLRRVAPGTDGGLSLVGTGLGVLAACLVALTGLLVRGPVDRHTVLVIAVTSLAAVAGLLFDSLLGATLERRGWLGNDLVNVTSTAVAAALPLLLPSFR